MATQQAGGWVVYRNPVDGLSGGTMGVCEAGEWRALDATRPGQLTLVHFDIPSEGQAERLARGTTGDAAPRANAAGRARSAFALPAAAP